MSNEYNNWPPLERQILIWWFSFPELKIWILAKNINTEKRDTHWATQNDLYRISNFLYHSVIVSVKRQANSWYSAVTNTVAYRYWTCLVDWSINKIIEFHAYKINTANLTPRLLHKHSLTYYICIFYICIF